MITFKSGDILNEHAEALVNTVNCVGIMGRGIALQFKKRFPQNFKAYELECKHGRLHPGTMFIHQVSQTTNPKFIINFPTKRHWKGKSHLKDIEVGLQDLLTQIQRYEIKSVAIPPLGCGLGGLDWNVVKPMILKSLMTLDDVEIVVFEPTGTPSAESMSPSKDIPKITPGRAALIGLADQYLRGLLDPFITLLEIHKLMYFMQESGENLRLRFEKNIYGPYAVNLSHVMNVIEGHYLSGYADGGDNPNKQISILPGALKDATEIIEQQPETIERFKRVSQLVQGFETPFGMELLATVHWVVQQEKAASAERAIEAVYAWNDRKRQFSPRQIELAYSTLKDRGWIQ